MLLWLLAQIPPPPAAPPAPAPIAPPAPPAASAPGGTLFDNVFWLTLLFIFLAAIISAIIRLRLRDKCLKLFDNYHASYVTMTGQVLWGDLNVFSQGLELRFDAPYRNRRGIIKNSALIYQAELTNCRAICRVASGLTAEEQRRREAQVKRSFNPGPLRRTLRWFHNLFNTIRDAFSKALSAFIGQAAKVHPGSMVLTTQRGSVEQIGQTIITAAPNAYEPMLEKHIGRPVVLELSNPADPEKRPLEFPGYLVEYSDKFVGVFNVYHEPLDLFELEVGEAPAVERPGVKVEALPDLLRITCTGPEALVVKRVESAAMTADLEVVLIAGCVLPLPRPPAPPGATMKLSLQLTRQVDLICPRAQASVRFGGERPQPRANWRGLAPEQLIESHQVDFLQDQVRRLLGWTGLRGDEDQKPAGDGATRRDERPSHAED